MCLESNRKKPHKTPSEVSEVQDVIPMAHSFPVVVKVISGTTYIVTGSESPTARETAVEKMRRIILKAPSLKPSIEP